MTLNIVINFRSETPIYLQITEQIRQKVALGELNAGDQLPTVRQMATELRINFNTVARAYRLLDESGLISTQHGRGTYIWNTAAAGSDHSQRQERLSQLAEKFIREAQQLGYSQSEIYLTMEQQFASLSKTQSEENNT